MTTSVAERLDRLRIAGYRISTQDKRLIEAGQVEMLAYHERELARAQRSKKRKPVCCSNCGDEVALVYGPTGWCGGCVDRWQAAPFREPDHQLPKLPTARCAPMSQFELEQYGL